MFDRRRARRIIHHVVKVRKNELHLKMVIVEGSVKLVKYNVSIGAITHSYIH